MAYLDLSLDWQTGHSTTVCDPVATPAPRLLDELERQVVLLSQYDGAWSVAPSGRAMRLVRRLFGIAPPQALGSARLEALRRFAVLLRLGAGEVGAAERQRFAEAGFSAAQADRVACLVAAMPPIRSAAPLADRAAVALTILAFVAVIGGGFGWAADYFGDRLVATTVAGLAAIVLLPLVTAGSRVAA